MAKKNIVFESKKGKIGKYALTVNEQVNPNLTKRLPWKNCEKALIHNSSTYASSTFTKESYIKEYKKETVTNKKTGKKETVKTPVYAWKSNHPWTLTGHNFQLNVPKGSFIKKIVFQVRMRGKGFKSCAVPQARFNIYGKAYQKDTTTVNHLENYTGWDDGIYYVSLGKKLTNSFKTYEYTMDDANLRKGGFTIDEFNAEVMGVDLNFPNAVFDNGKVKATKGAKYTGTIDITWIRMIVLYEYPKYNITYSSSTKSYVTGKSFKLTAKYSQSTRANGGTQVLDVNIPWGTDLESATVSGTKFNSTPTVNDDGSKTYKWTVPAKGEQSERLDMVLKPFIQGTNVITVGNDDTGRPKFTYNPIREVTDGYDGINLGFGETAHHGHPICATVDIEGYSENNTAVYRAVIDKEIEIVGWNLINASSGVSVYNVDGNEITLYVPDGERFQAYLNYCFIPKVTGKHTLTVSSLDNPHSSSIDFNVEDAYEYHIGVRTGNEILVDTHRIASTIDTSAYVIPLGVDEFDSLMYMSDCNISIYQWGELDYIGCVPLEHLHFDPKSTYKDKLLDTHYKNKRYMGKQLASDEDITLNVRLHPQQVTTIQGLIDMDKPIPINANHKCFESDALNHRGWAEIYGITTTETNPHWYKCEIDVKYLTHNLNTRFKIDRGNKVNQQAVNDLMGEVFGSGDPLSNNDIVDTEIGQVTDDFFMVDTDGTYMYIEDELLEVDYLDSEGHEIIYNGTNVYYVDSNNAKVYLTYINDNNESVRHTGATYTAFLEENNYTVSTPLVANEPIQIVTSTDVPPTQRNMFSIDNGQHIMVQSRNTLANVSEVSFEWASVLLDELEENNVERIIELVNKDGQSVFQYQYTDFEFEYDYSNDTPIVESVKCNPIARIYKNGAWEDKTEPITLRTVIGTGGDVVDYSDNASAVDSTDDIGEEDVNADTSELMFGSTLHLQINNHKLRIIDEGFNGMEWVLGDDETPIELEEGEYYWKTTWRNLNEDGETSDVVSFFDFTVSSTLLTSQFAEQYGNIVVSPFPVSDKTLLFTRDSQEGTIYYYQDDKEEFSYLIEPFYQYLCGCDLVTQDDVSIFNLNYGYEIVYIQNGLVRMGFDRLSEKGRIFLGKYDEKLGDYITTHNFRFDKYTDINVKSISDDKIEIQASDSIFTIWRGHPFIMINHNGEDIWIDSKFNKVWAERVGTGDDTFEYPIYWDLMNNANLFSECVGGEKGIKASCVEVDSRTINRQAVSLSGDGAFGEIKTGDTKTFQILSPTVSVTEDIRLENYTGEFGEYSVEFEVDSTVPYKIDALTLDKFVVKPNNIDLLGRVSDYDDVGVANQSVDFYEEFIRDKLYLSSNKEYVVKDDVAKFSATLLDVDSSKITDVPVLFSQEVDGNYSLSNISNTIVLDGESKTLSAKLYKDLLLDSATVHCESTGTNYCYSIGLDDLGLDLSDDDFTIEFEYKTTVNGSRVCLGDATKWSTGGGAGDNYIYVGLSTANNGGYGTKTSGTTDNTSIGKIGTNIIHRWKIVRTGSTISYYLNDELKGSKTVPSWVADCHDWSLYLQGWNTSDITVKDVAMNQGDMSGYLVNFYTDNDEYIEVIYPSADVEVASISLTGNKTVLSAYDSDKLTLTATAYDSANNPVPNKSLTFLKGSTEVKTIDTDNNGVATFNYNANGDGDLSFTVEADDVVSDAVSVEDCIYSKLSEVTETRGSGAFGSNLVTGLSDVANTNWELSFDLTTDNVGGCFNIGASSTHDTSNTANYRVGIGFDIISNTLKNYANNRTTTSSASSPNTMSKNTYYSFKLVKNGTTMTFYYDNTQFATKTVTWLENYNSFDIYTLLWNATGNTISYKNVKFKKVQ